MINTELVEIIHKKKKKRFYELGQYCLKETITLNYPIGKIILKYD